MKKLFAILMSVLMIACFMPTMAFADGEGTTPAGEESKNPVAQVGDQTYTSLSAAVEAVEENGTATITLLKDTTEDITIPAGKKVTLNLNGKTLTNSSSDTITVANGAELTIEGAGTVDNVTHAKAAIFNNGIAVLNGGTYDRSAETGASATGSGENSYYTIVNHGNMTIAAGVTVQTAKNNNQYGKYSSLVENGYYDYKSTNPRSGYVEKTNQAEPTLTINGGTFLGGLNTIKNDDVSLRLGAHVDVQAGHDGGVNFAPDVKLAYTFADSYVIYVQALGGSRLNDFRTLNDMSPYWAQLSQLRTSSTPLDAGIGLKASPVSGLGFHLYGGYRITKNELFSLPGIESFALADATHYTYNFLLQNKAKVGYGGASISYAYKDWIDFTLQGTYYGWNTNSDNELLLALKPEFAVGFYARSRIMKDLHIALDYRYEGRKDIAGQSITDPINSLSVSAEYELLNRITVFARLNNLLNKNYITETGYPVQGFNVMAGISVRF